MTQIGSAARYFANGWRMRAAVLVVVSGCASPPQSGLAAAARFAAVTGNIGVAAQEVPGNRRAFAMVRFTLPDGWRVGKEQRETNERGQSKTMVMVDPVQPSSVGIGLSFFNIPDATAIIEARIQQQGQPVRGPVYTTGSREFLVGSGTYIGGRRTATVRWLWPDGTEISDVYYVELPEHGGTVIVEVLGSPSEINKYVSAIKQVLTSITFADPPATPFKTSKVTEPWGVYFYAGPFELVLGPVEDVPPEIANQLRPDLRGKRAREFLVVTRDGSRHGGMAFLMTTPEAQISGVMYVPGQSVLLFDGIQECHLRLGARETDVNCGAGPVPANPPVKLTLRP
jgi:hypothetical protein